MTTGRAVLYFEILPLAAFLLALVLFPKFRKVILAAMIASPIPPIP